MDWDEIISVHEVGENPILNKPIYHYALHTHNLRAHLIASWKCIEELKKRVKELEDWTARYYGADK